MRHYYLARGAQWSPRAEYLSVFGVCEVGFPVVLGTDLLRVLVGFGLVFSSFLRSIHISFVKVPRGTNTVKYCYSISTILGSHDAPSVFGLARVINTCGMCRVHRIFRVIIGSVIRSALNDTFTV